jgi:hypothetical protein
MNTKWRYLKDFYTQKRKINTTMRMREKNKSHQMSRFTNEDYGRINNKMPIKLWVLMETILQSKDKDCGQGQTNCCQQEMHLTSKDRQGLKMKGWKIYSKQKEPEMSVLLISLKKKKTY